MVEKTITMSYDDYQMMSLDNKMYKDQYEKLAAEKMVYVTLRDPYARYTSTHVNKMSGQIVDKDELLKSMQTHLERCEERMKEQKIDYDLRIQKLNEELRQATMNPVETTVTRWWHKLLK